MPTEADIVALVQAAAELRDYLLDWSHRDDKIAHDADLGGAAQGLDRALEPFGR